MAKLLSSNLDIYNTDLNLNFKSFIWKIRKFLIIYHKAILKF